MKLDRRLGFLYRRFLVCNYFPPTSQPRKDERLTILVSNVPPGYKTSWLNVTASARTRLDNPIERCRGSARIYGIQKKKGTGTRDIISLYILADVTEGSLYRFLQLHSWFQKRNLRRKRKALRVHKHLFLLKAE